MRVGLKSQRIVVERPVDATDAHGDVLTTYTPAATVWASIEPLRGEERFEAAQVMADVTHRIRIRWAHALAELTPKWRLTHGTTLFDILSVADINLAHRELEIYAKVRL